MKINESKYGFVVKKRAEVSELNATMYEMEHIKTHLKLAWLKRDEENKTLVLRLKPYQVMIVGFSYFRTFSLMWF